MAFSLVGDDTSQDIDNSGLEAGGGYDYALPDTDYGNQTIIPGVDDDDVKGMITAHEGSDSKMYADTKGNVTVGVGQMLPDVQSAINLPFVMKDDDGNERPATDQEIAANYQSVKSGIHNSPEVELNPDDIDDLLDTSLRQSTSELKNKFPNYDDIPPPGKQGLLDMQYNIGNTKFTSANWPAFFDAINNSDWGAAAVQSHRKDVGPDRNLDIYNLFDGIPDAPDGLE